MKERERERNRDMDRNGPMGAGHQRDREMGPNRHTPRERDIIEVEGFTPPRASVGGTP